MVEDDFRFGLPGFFPGRGSTSGGGPGWGDLGGCGLGRGKQSVN